MLGGAYCSGGGSPSEAGSSSVSPSLSAGGASSDAGSLGFGLGGLFGSLAGFRGRRLRSGAGASSSGMTAVAGCPRRACR